MEEQTDKLVVNKNKDFKYELSGAGSGLVQAYGEITGIELYFRAKYDEWTFDVANDVGMLPSDGGQGGYFKKSKCKNAGYMTLSKAEKIISECIDDYLQKKNT
ncbi:MAG: hypothetical protein OEZ39_16315 [Gammaproteobacteria bacterium]|nr:hypothetical protein [Gammaproteobacteria bacterium]MDH5653424.1 hypothetical protein [Gammaproteobacteria bacterium]